MRCESISLVDASLDGRLGEVEQRSLQRHLASCAECTARLHKLELLKSTLRELDMPITPLEHQRARLALLRRAAAPARTARPRRVALLAAAVVFVPVAVWAARGAVVALRAPDPPPSPPASSNVIVETPPPPVVVVAPPPETATEAPTPPARRPAAGANVRSHASRDFADAMETVSRGDFGAAAAKLDRFTRDHPEDPRAEEALYLEAIALERAGRVPEASVVARRYLTTYPDGAHESQARRLAGE